MSDEAKRILRVFIRRTSQTPDDDLVAVGEPGLFLPVADEVHISVVFTWDLTEAKRLALLWRRHYPVVKIGGPACNDPGDTFAAGKYVKRGITFTSRGCPNNCWYCFVPQREGALRELPIVAGHIVQDNNLTACSRQHVLHVFKMLNAQRQAAEFAGGLEASRIDAFWIDRLQHVRVRQLFLAYDSPTAKYDVQSALERLIKAGLSRRALRCFILAGYPNDAMDKALVRCEEVWSWGGLPFVQLFRDETNKPHSQDWRRFQRTWSRPAAMFAFMNKGND